MTTLQAAAQKQLRQFVEQLERLEEEKKELGRDIKDKYLEAKAVGFDVKAIRKLIALRKKHKAERDEEQAILDIYMHALGMLSDMPLGEAAIEREFGIKSGSDEVHSGL